MPDKITLLATDHQQSVLMAPDATLPRLIAYLPYGYSSQASEGLSLLGFVGELPDSLTGHYQLGQGYRQYNPRLMRFNTPDRLSPFEEGGVNPYTYCAGDPINRVDPDGSNWVSKMTSALSNLFRRRRASNRPAAKSFANGYDGYIYNRFRKTPTSEQPSRNTAGGYTLNYGTPQHRFSPELTNLGPSNSLRKFNPIFTELPGLTTERSHFGFPEDFIEFWRQSTNQPPDKQLIDYTNIPRPGVVTLKQLSVQTKGIRMMEKLPKKARRLAAARVAREARELAALEQQDFW